MVYRDDAKSKNFVEYFYNENKLLTKAIFTDNDKISVINFQYKFDSYNNWIEQVKIIDDKTLYVRKREIVYWE